MNFKESFALLNVFVVDGHGGPPEENMAVVVKNGVIRKVQKMEEYQKEANVQEVSLDGHYVMPGLIDAHVHLSGGRAGLEDGVLGVIAEPKLLRAMRSVYEAQEILKRGFTSVRDISWNGLYLKRLFSGNAIPGPKVVACGAGLSRTGGMQTCTSSPRNTLTRTGFGRSLPMGRTRS